tara:strand:+ start:717 stop:1019 length:303 start_codon:yes stop_codon:yes gene_type:complete
MADSIETNVTNLKIEYPKPLYKKVGNSNIELTDDEYEAQILQWATNKHNEDVDQETNGYKDARLAEYPSFGEQLDYIYHNGIEAWKTDIILPIKEAHPKP